MPAVKIHSKLGFGTQLIGHQLMERFRLTIGTGGLCAPREYVEYLFVTVLYIPLFPLGCYRIKEYATQDIASITWHKTIVGEESYKVSEIIHIYLVRLVVPAIIIILLLKYV